MLPAIFGVSVTQINLLLNTVFASLMIGGSVSWLYAAERMSELPLGLIGVAIGTVILPSLSKSEAQKTTSALKDHRLGSAFNYFGRRTSIGSIIYTL